MAKVRVRVQEAASYRLDDIYRYTRDRWGEQQADRYITGLLGRALDIERVLVALADKQHHVVDAPGHSRAKSNESWRWCRMDSRYTVVSMAAYRIR